MDKLSLDLIADHHQLYTIHSMQFNKNQDSFSRLVLLLSGDIECNPGPIRNPCIICTGSVSKRGPFCINCGLGCHKKCNTTLPVVPTNFTCDNCNAIRATTDSGNLEHTSFAFSEFNNLEEQFDHVDHIFCISNCFISKSTYNF